MKLLKEILPRVLALFVGVMLVFGLLYTLLITGVGQLFFANKAGGSVITVNGKTYGSELLAQQYTDDTHLWGRMMVLDTETFHDKDGNPVLYAGPTNLSPASDEFAALLEDRINAIHAAHPEKDGIPIPVDLVTVSASGLDPHISVAAAEYQVARLARTTGKTQAEVQTIIDTYTTGRFLGIFGEARVNVLQVNLALDGILV